MEPNYLKGGGVEVETCEHCGRSRMMMVPMMPGRDGKEWFLCPRCYQDGLKPALVKETTVTSGVAVIPSTGELQGWTETISELVPASAKNETANFDKMSEGGAKPRPKQRRSR